MARSREQCGKSTTTVCISLHISHVAITCRTMFDLCNVHYLCVPGSRPCNDMPQCCCRRSALLVALQFTFFSSFFPICGAHSTTKNIITKLIVDFRKFPFWEEEKDRAHRMQSISIPIYIFCHAIRSPMRGSVPWTTKMKRKQIDFSRWLRAGSMPSHSVDQTGNGHECVSTHTPHTQLAWRQRLPTRTPHNVIRYSFRSLGRLRCHSILELHHCVPQTR